MLTAYAMKILWWALPKILGGLIDNLGTALALVESAEQKDQDWERRAILLGNLKLILPPAPEFIVRGYLEFLVVLYQVGVTSDALEAMENIVRKLDADSIASVDKRQVALSSFATLFPCVPERVARLMIELAVAKVRSMAGEA